MSVLQSKNVDLVIDKNQKIDLYDEQIDSNKNKSKENEGKIGNILGRLMTVETFVSDFENRIKIIEKGGSGTGVTLTDFKKLQTTVNDKLSPQVGLNKNDIASLKSRATALETNYNALNPRINSLTTNLQNLQSRVTASEKDNSSAKVTTVENDVKTAKADIAQIKNEVSTLTNKINTVQTTLDKKISTNTSTLTKHNTRITTLETKIKTDETNISNVTKQATINKNNIATLQSQVNTLNKTTAATTTSLNNLANAFNTFKTKDFKALSDKVTANAKSISNLTTRVTPVVKSSISIAANAKKAVDFKGCKLSSKIIQLYVYDNEGGSRTKGKWINSSYLGVGLISIQNDDQLIIYNDYDKALTFKVIVSPAT